MAKKKLTTPAINYKKDLLSIKNNKKKFLDLYHASGQKNATAAAINAGYAISSAKQQSYKMLQDPTNIAYLEHLQHIEDIVSADTLKKTNEHLEAIAFYDLEKIGRASPVDIKAKVGCLKILRDENIKTKDNESSVNNIQNTSVSNTKIVVNIGTPSIEDLTSEDDQKQQYFNEKYMDAVIEED